MPSHKHHILLQHLFCILRDGLSLLRSLFLTICTQLLFPPILCIGNGLALTGSLCHRILLYIPHKSTYCPKLQIGNFVFAYCMVMYALLWKHTRISYGIRNLGYILFVACCLCSSLAVCFSFRYTDP